MGTEIFPLFLKLMKFIVVTVGVVSLLTIVGASIQYYAHRANKKHRDEYKGLMINGLIAFVIVLIVYLLLIAIGPAFRALFL